MALQTIEQGKTKAPARRSADFQFVLESFEAIARTGLAGRVPFRCPDRHPALRIDRISAARRSAAEFLQRYGRYQPWLGRTRITTSDFGTTGNSGSAVWNTVQFAAISVFIKFWLGLAGGNAAQPPRASGSASVFTGLVLLPWIIPEVVAALTWRGLYDPIFGGLNVLLLELGIIDDGNRLARGL